MVKEGISIYLGGICKYSQFQIQNIMKQNFCDEFTASIFIEEETCLSLANLCKKNTRNEKGNILLLFAYRLNDNVKDWNENKNLLGINPNWNFITPDEL